MHSPHAQQSFSREELLRPHHRSVGGGPIRAGIFGISDGLVSNVSLVLGFAGAAVSPSTVRLAGFAGLLAGAFSMAAGEYISMKAQTELLEFELEKERRQLADSPEFEAQELSAIYQERGISKDTADRMAIEVMKDPHVALEMHAREEMGIDPNDLGSPIGAMLYSFLAFVVGAFVPLVPWLIGSGTAAIVSSVVATAVVAFVLGWILGKQSGRHPFTSALRQLAVAVAAAATTYFFGVIFGATV